MISLRGEKACAWMALPAMVLFFCAMVPALRFLPPLSPTLGADEIAAIYRGNALGMQAGAILMMSWFHGWLSARRKDFARGTNTRSGRTYRIMNEVPTVLMLVIVFSVILRY